MPKSMPALPTDLALFAQEISEGIRVGAALKENHTGVIPPMGFTHWLGKPDLPKDADWTSRYSLTEQSPLDGPCFWLQVNLEDIPSSAKAYCGAPDVGMVWVFLDLSTETWNGSVHFDSRRARDISWHPRNSRSVPNATQLHEFSMYAETVELIEQFADAHLESMYSDYARQSVPRYEPYFGGYAWGIQSDQEDSCNTIFCTMRSDVIGDCGAAYLHYSAKNGFWVTIETH